ncbi:MAG: pilin [Betaproteobacteria bacterium]
MQRHIRRAQRGFTLIELMIVVAIIAILAAIAIPQYQNYTRRAKVSDALTIAAPYRTAVSERFQVAGPSTMTCADVDADCTTNLGLPGARGNANVVDVDVAAGGTITIELTTAVSGAAAGATSQFVIQPVTIAAAPAVLDLEAIASAGTPFQWRCGRAAANAALDNVLPIECRQASL